LPADAPAFLERWEAGARWVFDPAYEAPLRALGLPAPAAVRRLLAAAEPADGGRAGTAVVALPDRGERLHLRPVRHGGLLARAWGSRVVGLARPLAELRVTAALRSRGAPVPRPLCAVGWRAAPLWSAALGTLHVEGARDGLAWLADPHPGERIEAAARAAGRAVRRFHDAGGRHADLHLGNLLLREGADGPEVLVIDLDGARAEAPPDPRRRMRELARLHRSVLKRRLQERVGRSGRAAFLAAYLDGDATLGRALAAHWPAERRRVADSTQSSTASASSTSRDRPSTRTSAPPVQAGRILTASFSVVTQQAARSARPSRSRRR
jgi:3-deoxy-D-manno-octulosonic acid kinase